MRTSRIFLFLGSLLMVFSTQVRAYDDDYKSVMERVTLNDGREVELYQDHTWGYVRRHKHFRDDRSDYLPHNASEAVQVWNSTLDWVGGDPYSKVRLFIHYQNRTSRRVVGVSVAVTITDSFGRILKDFTDDDEVTIEPNQQMTNRFFYSWSNDPADDDGTYDLLRRVARGGTAHVSVKVTRVVFEDGTQLTNDKDESAD